MRLGRGVRRTRLADDRPAGVELAQGERGVAHLGVTAHEAPMPRLLLTVDLDQLGKVREGLFGPVVSEECLRQPPSNATERITALAAYGNRPLGKIGRAHV